MGHDFQFGRGEFFGEWLHKELLEAVVFEDAPWAINRIRRRALIVTGILLAVFLIVLIVTSLW
jgi:hypothetical protein